MRKVDGMVRIWLRHFECLATSGADEHEGLRSLAGKMQELAEQSRENEEFILDASFTAVEVEHALSSLKRKTAADPEGLMAEHLQEAGCEVQVWLRNVLNAVVEWDEVPSTYKSGYSGLQGLRQGSGENRQLSWHHLIFCNCLSYWRCLYWIE